MRDFERMPTILAEELLVMILIITIFYDVSRATFEELALMINKGYR